MHFQPILLISQKKFVRDDAITFIQGRFEEISLHNINILGEGDGSSIGIKEVSNLANKISSISEERRVHMILNSERMSEEAQNSLLKTLEEPTKNTLIIIHTKNTDYILETIRSRTSIYYDESEFQYNDSIYSKFLNSNLIQRKSIIEEISKMDNPREFASELILYIMSRREEKLLNEYDRLVKVYRAIKQGANLKLSLDVINLILE